MLEGKFQHEDCTGHKVLIITLCPLRVSTDGAFRVQLVDIKCVALQLGHAIHTVSGLGPQATDV